MKIMYVAPRYHTNQIDAIKGWIDRGDEVKFISYYTSIIESYDVITPEVLGFSPIYNFFDRMYLKLHKGDIYADGFKIKHGIPPIKKFRKIINEWKPDVIIFRERSLYTIVGYMLSKKISKCILYNQSPLWDEPLKNDWKHKVVYKLTPPYRFTPCMGRKEDGKEVAYNASFIPFVVNPQFKKNSDDYFKNHQVNILCIGVFEPRKNHMLLIDALSDIKDKVFMPIQLTIIGEASNPEQKAFLEIVNEHIEKSRIADCVDVYTNVSRGEVSKYYTNADLFVIPSTREPASISQLEAMSYSVAAICSDTNGSACYVVDEYNGYQFMDNDKLDLEDKLLKVLENGDRLKDMGMNAYESIVSNNSFEKYFEGISNILAIIE